MFLKSTSESSGDYVQSFKDYKKKRSEMNSKKKIDVSTKEEENDNALVQSKDIKLKENVKIKLCN
jgi:hypothetical protein